MTWPGYPDRGPPTREHRPDREAEATAAFARSQAGRSSAVAATAGAQALADLGPDGGTETSAVERNLDALAALVDEAEDNIDHAVWDGRISEDQGDARLSASRSMSPEGCTPTCPPYLMADRTP